MGLGNSSYLTLAPSERPWLPAWNLSCGSFETWLAELSLSVDLSLPSAVNVRLYFPLRTFGKQLPLTPTWHCPWMLSYGPVTEIEINKYGNSIQ